MQARRLRPSDHGSVRRVLPGEPATRDSYRSSAVLPLDSTNVLICLRYGIGDVIMELPALTALRDMLPHARITALANPPAHELLEGDPRVDALVTSERWGLRHRWDPGREETRAAITGWIREQGFDLVLDAAQAPLAIGEAIWAFGYRSLEADSGAERRALEAGASGVEAIRASVRSGWGMQAPSDRRPRLDPREEDRARADALLEGHGLREQRPFAVSPVTAAAVKRWPVERFSAVADHVIARGRGPVLILEGPQAEVGEAVVEAMRCRSSAIRVGPLHLLTTAALLGRCSALVCNDTGIMHVAGAAGTPIVAAFGATRAAYFLPPGPRTRGIEPAELECAYRETRSLHPPACWRDDACLIADRPCIDKTRTEDVIAAVESLLDRPAPEHRLHAAAAHGRAGFPPG